MSERESWMPTEQEINDALLEDGFYDVHQSIEDLIRRAAATRALEIIENANNQITHAALGRVLYTSIVALKAELSPITAAEIAAEGEKG